jgi:hypothetical protein
MFLTGGITNNPTTGKIPEGLILDRVAWVYAAAPIDLGLEGIRILLKLKDLYRAGKRYSANKDDNNVEI